MKKFTGLLTVAVLAGVITLGSYKLFIEQQPTTTTQSTQIAAPQYAPVSYTPNIAAASGKTAAVRARAREAGRRLLPTLHAANSLANG